MKLYAQDKAAENWIIGIAITVIAVGIVLACCNRAHGEVFNFITKEGNFIQTFQPATTGKNIPILTDNLNLWMAFTADTGTNYTDSSASNLLCTTTAQPTWSTNASGSVRFDGAQSIKVGPLGTFGSIAGQDLTMAVWFKETNTHSGILFSETDTSNGNTFGKIIYVINNAGPYFQLRKQNTGSGDVAVPTQILNKWMLVTATYTNGIMRVYTNAVSVNTASYTPAGTIVGGSQPYLGRYDYAPAPLWYSGEIGFAAYWRRGLVESEVTNLFNYTKGYFGY